jgi:OHS family lactose permease-like MFS transporter
MSYFFVNVIIVASTKKESVMMKVHSSQNYRLLSALLFFFFVSWSSSASLLSIWLHQEVGLKAGDTGIIFAVLSATALIVQICYGFIQDKLGLRKHLLWSQ